MSQTDNGDLGALSLIGESRMWGGRQMRFQHTSQVLDCDMNVGVFLPEAAQTDVVPVLYWLSGLTCTDENFMMKAGAQWAADRLGIALVAPDTSPRGVDIEGEDDDWAFGSGAGFYVDATQEPWAKHYQMASYVSEELPGLLESELPLDYERRGISGHSMGGHGALVTALRNPGLFRSVSAFAPICAPMQSPWGQKAFAGYLGEDQESWAAYDAIELLAGTEDAPEMLVDQGTADEWLEGYLLTDRLEAVCRERGHTLQLRMQEDFDHGYWFVSTFIDDHLEYHAERLQS